MRRRRTIKKGPYNRLKLLEVGCLGVWTSSIKRFFVCQNPYVFTGPLKTENLLVSSFFQIDSNPEILYDMKNFFIAFS